MFFVVELRPVPHFLRKFRAASKPLQETPNTDDFNASSDQLWLSSIKS